MAILSRQQSFFEHISSIYIGIVNNNTFIVVFSYPHYRYNFKAFYCVIVDINNAFLKLTSCLTAKTITSYMN